MRSFMQKHIQLLIAFGGILIVFLLPLPVAVIIQEENPDDSAAKALFQSSPLEFDIEGLPPKTTAVSLWTGDTIRASNDTPLTIQMGADKEISTTLKHILRNGRELMLPIDTGTTSLHIKISAPTLPMKEAIVIRTQQTNIDILAYTVFVRKPFIHAVVKKMYAEKTIANDIEYVWKEGSAILRFENPYRQAEKQIRNGDKYPPYFPLSYIVSAGIQKVGFVSFEAWMTVVRPIILLSQFFCASLILYYLAKKDMLTLGLFAFFLILFHRFALYPARVTHIDFPAIAFLLLGLILITKKPKTAYMLIGVSLAIKQMAIFIIPALLIYEWHQSKSVKKVLISFVYIAFIPIVTLTPFVIDSAIGTMRSIIFAAERAATGDFASPDMATLLAFEAAWSRLPMLAMFMLIYSTALRKEVRIFGATLAIFTIFIGFNPVLFFQYLAWIIPFIPLAISEATSSESPSQSSHRLRDT